MLAVHRPVIEAGRRPGASLIAEASASLRMRTSSRAAYRWIPHLKLISWGLSEMETYTVSYPVGTRRYFPGGKTAG
jgi:hypothetical protein